MINGVGGTFTGEALGSFAPNGTIVVVGYSGGKQAGVNLTDIIWRSARVRGFMFSLFSRETIQSANEAILGLLGKGGFHPAIARTFPLEDAAAATRYLVEDRPYGRVVQSVGNE